MSGKKELSRLCIHTVTTKPWLIETAIEKYYAADIHGISIWRNYLDGQNLSQIESLLRNANMDVVSLVRGGFFTSKDQKTREKAIHDNKKAIDQAKAVNASMLVLVCGSTPGQSLEISRNQIREALDNLLPYAEKNSIKLAIEPLHPMYSDTRSAVNTMGQANEIVNQFNSEWLGVVFDVYHQWWDPDLPKEVIRCAGKNKLFGCHISDWRVPTRDILNDREIMGKGIIDIQFLIDLVNKTGYSGYFEVEIFSDHYWSMDQDDFLAMIIKAYKKYKIN